MAYFTKEQYEAKREYAARVSASNEEILANARFSDDDIETLIKLSHTRHKLHCAKGEELRRLFDEVGTQYSFDKTLVDFANEIAEKYNLPNIHAPYIPEVDVSDDNYLIAEYFDISEEELEARYFEIYNDIYELWEEAKNKVSYDIRVFFYYVNDRYGTDFPQVIPNKIL